ncbi:MAG: ribonuclease D [Nanobdellota archaeon]
MFYVDNEEKLEQAVSELSKYEVIGIDLECENNLHHYGQKLALIQISSDDKDYVIDPITIKDISAFKKLMHDDRITKIFHDVNFDFEVLQRLGCKPKNIFDSQLAASFLDFEKTGLKSLLEELYNVSPEKKFQKADWTKRPLKKEMLEYAVMDTKYLIGIYHELRKRLKKEGKLSWVEEEFKHLENKDYPNKKPTYIDVKGAKSLEDTDRAVFKRLFDLRERLASKVDRPVHFLIHSKRLIELAKQKNTSVKFWSNLKRVHPIVRKKAEDFSKAVRKGKEEKLPFRKENKKLKPVQKKHYSELLEKRKKIAEENNIEPSQLMSKDQILDIVLTGKNRSLRDWQKRLMSQNLS